MSVSSQAVRLPVNSFESDQHRQFRMPGRNDGMKNPHELHSLCAKCKLASASLEMFKSLVVQTSTGHPRLKAEVQQPA